MNRRANLKEVVIDIAEQAIKHPDVYLLPGKNGPYRDRETPVRNYGHWLIIFARCYEWTEGPEFKEKVLELAEYLCSEKARPYGYSFHHRNKVGKDKCNGLIGQAWTLEALGVATRLLGNTRYSTVGEEVFFQHPFNENHGLWNRVEIDGNILPLDVAFNHQLWFAASACQLKCARSAEVNRRVVRFLDRLDENCVTFQDGLIYHPIEHLLKAKTPGGFSIRGLLDRALQYSVGAIKGLRFSEKQVGREERERKIRGDFVYKSIGYHAFNTYAFAILKQEIPGHCFWESERIDRVVSYLLTETYLERLKENRYGYPYNPPGFEVPYSLIVLAKLDRDHLLESCEKWVGEQFKRCFEHSSLRMSRNTEDPVTHTARMYELTRMPEEMLIKIGITAAE